MSWKGTAAFACIGAKFIASSSGHSCVASVSAETPGILALRFLILVFGVMFVDLPVFMLSRCFPVSH